MNIAQLREWQVDVPTMSLFDSRYDFGPDYKGLHRQCVVDHRDVESVVHVTHDYMYIYKTRLLQNYFHDYLKKCKVISLKKIKTAGRISALVYLLPANEKFINQVDIPEHLKADLDEMDRHAAGAYAEMLVRDLYGLEKSTVREDIGGVDFWYEKNLIHTDGTPVKRKAGLQVKVDRPTKTTGNLAVQILTLPKRVINQ